MKFFTSRLNLLYSSDVSVLAFVEEVTLNAGLCQTEGKGRQQADNLISLGYKK